MNIVVTGAKGQLGSYLVDYLRNKSLKDKSPIGKVFGIGRNDLDVTNHEAVADFFNRHTVDPIVDIDFVVHCAAATDTKAIEAEPSRYYAANVLGAKNIAEACAYNKIKMVFVSTDYVFSEHSIITSHGPVRFPVNQYGMQKALAEEEVSVAFRRRPHDFVIARPSWLFGNSSKSFVEKLLANVARAARDGKTSVNVVDDCYGRPTHVQLAAKKIYDVICHIYANHKHISAFDCQPMLPQISRFEWATLIWKAFSSAEGIRLSDNIAAIEIAPCKSEHGNGIMQHPGKVGDGKPKCLPAFSIDSDPKKDYGYWTDLYVNDNLAKLQDMFDKILNGEIA